MIRSKVGQTRGDRIFDFINNVLVTLLLLSVLYPIIFVISASVSSSNEVLSGRMWLLPRGLNFDAYSAIFKEKNIWLGYRNTILYTTTGTFINLSVTLFAAYALSRKELPGRNLITLIFSFTIFFSGGLIPSYLVVRSLGLFNSPLAIILPASMSMMNVIIVRTFMQSTIPAELFESARIDGCDYFKFFWRIIIPLSTAVIAVITLYTVVGFWNSYFSALLYLSDRKLYPLQLVLREILLKDLFDETVIDYAEAEQRSRFREIMKYALIIISSAPVLILYPFISKHFVKGVMIGSIKG